MTYEEFEWAKKVLNISIPVSFKKLEKTFRKKVKETHPDISSLPKDEANKKTTDLTKAFKIIKEYCKGYRFDFSEEEFYKQHPEEKLRRLYKNDPLWGKNT